MSITGGMILFATLWFLVFFIVLQIRPGSQAATGRVEPGTPPGAPEDAQIWRKAKITSVIAVVLWTIIAAILLGGFISVRDIDWFNRLGPEPAQAE
ncbi:MAG: DUF1467 family protein [Albidovulum sp.]